MDDVIAMFDDPQSDIHGRFLKYVVEPLGNLEIARRLHLEYVEGTRLDHDRENRTSGVYVQTSFTHDERGQPIYPRLRGVRALITNLLVNTTGPIVRGLHEFDVNWEYLQQHATLLDAMYHQYLIETEYYQEIVQEIHEMQASLTGTSSAEIRLAAGLEMTHDVLRSHLQINLQLSKNHLPYHTRIPLPLKTSSAVKDRELLKYV